MAKAKLDRSCFQVSRVDTGTQHLDHSLSFSKHVNRAMDQKWMLVKSHAATLTPAAALLVYVMSGLEGVRADFELKIQRLQSQLVFFFFFLAFLPFKMYIFITKAG